MAGAEWYPESTSAPHTRLTWQVPCISRSLRHGCPQTVQAGEQDSTEGLQRQTGQTAPTRDTPSSQGFFSSNPRPPSAGLTKLPLSEPATLREGSLPTVTFPHSAHPPPVKEVVLDMQGVGDQSWDGRRHPTLTITTRKGLSHLCDCLQCPAQDLANRRCTINIYGPKWHTRLQRWGPGVTWLS